MTEFTSDPTPAVKYIIHLLYLQCINFATHAQGVGLLLAATIGPKCTALKKTKSRHAKKWGKVLANTVSGVVNGRSQRGFICELHVSSQHYSIEHHTHSLE